MHDVQAYRGVKEGLHTFFISTQDRHEWSLSPLCSWEEKIPHSSLSGGLAGYRKLVGGQAGYRKSRAILGSLEWKKISRPCREI